MKKHLVIMFFYLLFSWFLVESFSRDSSNIDVYLLFIVVAMFLGWVLNLSPQIRVWFLFWTLGVGGLLSWYVHQEVLLRGPSQYTYEYYMGRGYKVNSTVRNYSLNRAREIERAKQRSYSGSSGSSYSGGSSHYGGGLSGGK